MLVLGPAPAIAQEAEREMPDLEARRERFNREIAELLGPVAGTPPLELDERAVVNLAIRDSLTILLAQYSRVEQRQRLRVSRDEFLPDLGLFLSQSLDWEIDRSLEGDPFRTEQRDEATRIAPTLSWRLPTGGRFVASYTADRDLTDEDSGSPTPPSDEPPEWEANWRMVLAQPLLRGGGIRTATADYQRAEIREKQDLLRLENTLSTAISTALRRYRGLVAAERNFENRRRAYERGLNLLESNLIQFAQGTMSTVEIEQAEATLARREIALLSAANALDVTRLNLLRFLRLPIETAVRTRALGEAESLLEISMQEARETARANRQDLAISQLNLEAVELGLAEARNNALWDLDLVGSVRSLSFGEPRSWSGANRALFGNDVVDYSVAATLSIPLYGDKTRRRELIDSKIDILRANTLHDELYAELMTEVVNALRSLRISHRQLEIARNATRLSRRSYEAELERLQAGLSSTFQVRQVEDALLEAEADEISSTITYLNAVTTLRTSMGVLPETWNVDIEVIREDARSLEDDLDNETLRSLFID